ncbi:hypothetical protein ABQ179_011835 [Xanthomonas dyei]|uniref:hypothetical protein n=1 Tax=Xanthomonas dyei TaxID=743699 RepID=UPI0032E87211
MQNFDTSTWISILALVVSLLSLAAAIWASYVGQQSLSHARKTYDEQLSISFVRERSQLLQLITQNQAVLEKTRLRIGALKAKFDASPQPAQVLLHNYTDLFTEYLPRIEGSIRQCSALWHEVAEWDERKGIHALVHHQARYRALMEDDQIAHDQGLIMVGIVEQKLSDAMAYFSGATR